jgi:hypothetical protein
MSSSSILDIIGWIVWGPVAIVAAYLIVLSIRYIIRERKIDVLSTIWASVILFELVITATFPVSKLHLLWVVPTSMLLVLFLPLAGYKSKPDQAARRALAAALEAEIARRDRAQINSTNTIKLYSFDSLHDLHLSYAFSKNRYSGQIGLYKSHVVANYAFFLVFLSPTLDGWGEDKIVSAVISALPSFF